MATFLLRRVLALVPLLLLISFGVFALELLIPGDPARQIAGGLTASEARVKEVRHQLHLDKPLLDQYGRWLSHASHGDLGKSLFNNRTVASDLKRRFPITLSMAVGALLVILVIGVPLGIAAGTHPGTWIDRVATVGSSVGIAMPDFWLAMLLVIVFAVRMHLLPAIGYTSFGQSPVLWAKHLVMPCVALGLGGAATTARQLRGSLIDVLDQDYIRTAEAKGLHRRSVIGKHALKNAAMPVVTILGIQFAYLLGGTVILEQIFSIPGMGQYLVQAIVTHDLPVIQGVTLVVAVTFVLLNLLVDVSYGFLNPKVRIS